MNIGITMIRPLVFALGSALAFGAAAQDDVTINITPVAGSVHMLTGQGGNIGLSVGEDGVFMVDDQFAPLTAKIKAAIAEKTDQPIKFVINTHWHFDHTGGNENLGEDGAVIVAHHNVRKRMSTDQVIKFFNREVSASPKVALPVITFGKGVTFHLNGDTIKVKHVPPAHTDGDSIVWFKQANVLHTGDLFFNGLYPFIDVGSGGSVGGIINAVNKLVPKLDDNSKVIPGHGPLTDRAGLKAYGEMLTDIRNNVRTLIKAGSTAEQVVAAKPTQAHDAKWGNGFIKPDQFAKMVYESLMNPPKGHRHHHKKGKAGDKHWHGTKPDGKTQ